jgi:inositol 1,4,5-triphosphate receptor type 1
MVFLNLIAGIIIDTFGELRDELNDRDKDAKTVCFICGLTKWQVEKKGQDFQRHKKTVHQKWYYFYFMFSL